MRLKCPNHPKLQKGASQQINKNHHMVDRELPHSRSRTTTNRSRTTTSSRSFRAVNSSRPSRSIKNHFVIYFYPRLQKYYRQIKYFGRVLAKQQCSYQNNSFEVDSFWLPAKLLPGWPTVVLPENAVIDYQTKFYGNSSWGDSQKSWKSLPEKLNGN